MKLVLRAVLEHCEMRPAGEVPEVTRRRGITFSPSDGSNVILSRRTPAVPLEDPALERRVPIPA